MILKMKIKVDIQNISDSGLVPKNNKIKEWVKAALVDRESDTELTIRIVDEDEGRELNERWRHSKGPTNVLSFPFEDEGNLMPELLGDIIICAPVIEREAQQQHKKLDSHWAHIVIHGTLHLLGYDHEKKSDAEIMENFEIKILEKLGYSNPYK